MVSSRKFATVYVDAVANLIQQISKFFQLLTTNVKMFSTIVLRKTYNMTMMATYSLPISYIIVFIRPRQWIIIVDP